MTDERRQHARHGCRLRATLAVGDEPGSVCHSVNVSAGGILVHTDRPVPVGTTALFSLQLRYSWDENDFLTIAATVTRCGPVQPPPGERERYEVAAEFASDLPASDRERLGVLLRILDGALNFDAPDPG